ncbi:hypothetical protein ACWDV7_35460 [Streptomyces sp. NPDC003362]
MIYGHHRAKGAPAPGARPGRHGPFGQWPATGEEDDADVATEELEPVAALPTPTGESGR